MGAMGVGIIQYSYEHTIDRSSWLEVVLYSYLSDTVRVHYDISTYTVGRIGRRDPTVDFPPSCRALAPPPQLEPVASSRAEPSRERGSRRSTC